jgi:hypothetical protein
MNPGGHGAGATPDPIPNSEVKPGNADETMWAHRLESLCHYDLVGSAHPTGESRTPPELFHSSEPAS